MEKANKGLRITLVLLVALIVSANLAWAQSAKDAYRALYALQSAIDNNARMIDLERAYRNADMEINMYLDSPQSKSEEDIANTVKYASVLYFLLYKGVKSGEYDVKSAEEAERQLKILGLIVNRSK
ncbi:MAG: hypothetical protein KQI62_02570 [Deltaproteobacteria bacterium]|nr:hypothetical protein [Deltaproteobacteria bacterium]